MEHGHAGVDLILYSNLHAISALSTGEGDLAEEVCWRALRYLPGGMVLSAIDAGRLSLI